MKVKTIKNSPVDSNCFVVYDNDHNNCVIIDPGTKDSIDLIVFLEYNNLIPKYIILTHEHFDHVWGVNSLLKKYDSVLVGSTNCLEAIKDKKKNLSVFYDYKGFEVNFEKSLKNIEEIEIHGKEILIISTPGHTASSISLLIENKLFTGDTLMKHYEIITKLPSGNKIHLIDTLRKLYSEFKNKSIIVYPGHGSTFLFDDLNINNII